MTLQAYFDESGGKGQGRYMVISGLLGEAQLFAEVADQWDKHLYANHPGRIRYFKLREACTLSGEFNYWDSVKRDEKVLQMAGVIDRSDLVEVIAVVDLQAFAKTEARWKKIVPGRHALNQPYLLACSYVLTAAAAEASITRHSTSRMEIVFDEHDLFRPVLARLYPSLCEGVAEGDGGAAFEAVLPVQPWFRDDKEFVILQAADLLAGERRLGMEDGADNPAWVKTLCKKIRTSPYSMFFDEDFLTRQDETLTKRLRSISDASSGHESD